ncbi:unnamed protein product [Amoebophrya sp. A25]|nr:unnamed protein product [Amoebophrya sp. A25]|eukprot:GSA25T00001818001.1
MWSSSDDESWPDVSMTPFGQLDQPQRFEMQPASAPCETERLPCRNFVENHRHRSARKPHWVAPGANKPSRCYDEQRPSKARKHVRNIGCLLDKCESFPSKRLCPPVPQLISSQRAGEAAAGSKPTSSSAGRSSCLCCRLLLPWCYRSHVLADSSSDFDSDLDESDRSPRSVSSVSSRSGLPQTSHRPLRSGRGRSRRRGEDTRTGLWDTELGGSKVSRTSLDRLFLSSDDEESTSALLYEKDRDHRFLPDDDREDAFYGHRASDVRRSEIQRGVGRNKGGRGSKKHSGTGNRQRTLCCLVLFPVFVILIIVAGCAWIKAQRRPVETPARRRARIRYNFLETASEEKQVMWHDEVEVNDANWLTKLLAEDAFPRPRTPDQIVAFLEVKDEEPTDPLAPERGHDIRAQQEQASAGARGVGQFLPFLAKTPPKPPARMPSRGLLGPLDKTQPLQRQIQDLLSAGLEDDGGTVDLSFLLAMPELRLSLWDTTILEVLSVDFVSRRETDPKPNAGLSDRLAQRPHANCAAELYFKSGRNLLVNDGAVIDLSPEMWRRVVDQGISDALKPMIERLRQIANDKSNSVHVPGPRFRQRAGLLSFPQHRDRSEPNQIRILGHSAEDLAQRLKQKFHQLFGSKQLELLAQPAFGYLHQDQRGVPNAVLSVVNQELARILAPVAAQVHQVLSQHAVPGHVIPGAALGGGPPAPATVPLQAPGMPALAPPPPPMPPPPPPS